MWKCPNNHDISYVLVCGGEHPHSNETDTPNVFFRMTLNGEYTNKLENGDIGTTKEMKDHADGGCCSEPICPICNVECEQSSELTSEQFKQLCIFMEHENGFDDVDEVDVKENGPDGLQYEATFRDEYNYKIPFTLFWDSGYVSWNEPEFNADEEEDTKPFFQSFIPEVIERFVAKLK